METSSRGPIVIEFNGLPGCGKSTTARALKDRLNKLHHTSVTSYYKTSLYKKKIVQLFWHKNIVLIFRLLRLALLQKDVYAALPGLLAICRYNQMYHMYAKNRNDVLLIDQGIAQGFLSMSHTNHFARPDLIEKIASTLNLQDIKFVMVNCDISVEESLCRIQKRHTNGGRLDNMDNIDLTNALKVQDMNLRTIRSCLTRKMPLDSITISTHDSVEDNVDKIIKII